MSRTFGACGGRWAPALAAGAIVAALALVGATAHAQGATIVGRVTDARSGQGVMGATIEIEGTRLAATASDEGRYRIANVPAGTRSVVARRIGYALSRRPITVVDGQDATVDIALQTTAVSLDQVVVTGTAGGEQLRSIGNSVSTINATEVLEKSAAPDLGSLLNARTPGVVLTQGSGRLGAGPTIQIRGRSSIGLGNSPLIYIDGVRVNDAVATGPSGVSGGLGGQNSQVAGRLNDIMPEDIERIEVIKGPAASTLYGTEASNGVIQIITKKGAVGGKPEFALQVQQGTIFFRDDEGRLPTNYARNSANQIVTWNAIKQERDRGTPLFKTGRTSLVNGSLSGGRTDLRYYVSAAYENDKGIEPNNTLGQFSTHANLNLAITPKLDFATSVNYVDLRNHLGVDYGASAMFAAVLGHSVLFPAARGFSLNLPPEITQQLYDNSQNVNRLTASGTLQHAPATWFRQRLIMGVDYTGDDSRALERYAPPSIASIMSPTAAAGRIGQTLRRNVSITGDYSGTASASITSALSQAFTIGGQVFRTELNRSFLGGLGFAGSGVELVSATAQPVTPVQDQTLNTTIGAYAQEKFNWRDRLYLTGALRVDNNSAFGKDFKWITYPKVDASWVVTEEPFWKWSRFINTLRLRAAYGESGRQPNAFVALRSFDPVQGPGGVNAITPGTIGNSGLKPERGKEFEAGFEAGLFERLSVDFTYFNKRTYDEIIDQAVAPSSGFPGTRPLNLGRVDNHGIELGTTAQILTGRTVQWELFASIATNRDVIKDLGGVPSLIASAGQYNKVGGPIGGIYTKRVISADRDPATNRATNVLCDNGSGGGVACASAPFLFLGTPTPKTSGAVANTLTLFNDLRLYALVDFKRGHRVQNANELLRCTGALGAGLCEANYYPERYAPLYLAEIVGNASTIGIVDQFYQDASFTKLREVSATYTIPSRFVRGVRGASIQLAARELHTWTKYRGPDPEVKAGSTATANTLDQGLIPPLSRFTATFNLRF